MTGAVDKLVSRWIVQQLHAAHFQRRGEGAEEEAEEKVLDGKREREKEEEERERGKLVSQAEDGRKQMEAWKGIDPEDRSKL